MTWVARWIWLTLLSPMFEVGVAHAHEFPTSFGVLFGEPERIVVALRPGLGLSENAGASWNFLCGAVTGVAGAESYPLALGPDGVLWVGAYAGLYRDDGMGCSWTRVHAEGLPSGRIVAVAAREDGVEVLTGLPAASNGLYLTQDQGGSWQPQGTPLPAMAVPNAYRRAGDRIYVTGTDAQRSVLWASGDGGETWEVHALSPSFRAEIVGVDPADPQRLMVWLSAPEEPLLRQQLVLSEDAGQTYRTVLELTEFGGLAWDAEIWVGDRSGGLYRLGRDLDAQKVQELLRVGCVAVRDGKLWVCANDGDGGDPFALATSTDGGRTFTPFLRSDQVRRLRTCGNPNQAAACGGEWAQWKNDVFGSTDDPPLMPVAMPSDAGVAMPALSDAATPVAPTGVASGPAQPATSVSSSESGCRTVGRGGPGPTGTLVALMFVLLARRRREG